jgi:cytochrome c oxidase subunit III
MAATLIPPTVEPESELSLSNSSGGGTGGGPSGPSDELRRTLEHEPERATPLSAYRIVAVVAIVWIAALFATLMIVLESRWAHAPDWRSIPLPRILFVNTAVLLLSSLTVELARFALRAGRANRFGRWILATLWMGFTFLVGQAFAWRELVSRGLHLASNPGSFLLYLITGIHGLFLVGGMVLLASVGFLVGRAADSSKQKAAMGSIALYWHFLDGLWLCLLAVFLVTL